ncbi:MAG: hypothetical protein AB1894_07355 [Chloroflexota bacterium]
MSFSFRHLKRLEQGTKVPIPSDEDGLVGRGCPNPDCLGYFKIKFGTGLKGENLPCHCPYCGHTAGQDHFWTQDQLEYARSIMANEVSQALKADVQEWDRELQRSTRSSFIKLSMEYKGQSHPIYHYQEKQLETKVTCDVCTLEYAIYGLFAFCPDCGTHNSPQILKKNLELVIKLLALADEEHEPELAGLLIVNALETAVSTFDGFGRSYCEAHADQIANPDQARNISFQNLAKARTTFQAIFSKDIAQSLTDEEWNFALGCFQKRHLFAHKMGIVDDAYLKMTADPGAIVGRKIKVTLDEIRKLISLLIRIGEQF